MNSRSLALSLVLTFNVGCHTVEKEPEPRPKEKSGAPAAPSGAAPLSAADTLSSARGAPREGEDLLQLPSSAYSATLHVDGETLYVVTPSEIVRWNARGELERTKLDLGSAMTPRKSEFIFVQDGALKRFSWGGKASTLLRAEKVPPERVAASESGVFTLQRTSEGTSRVSLLVEGKLKKLYETPALIATLAAREDSAYFAESMSEGFRLVSVSKEGETTFGPSHPGRTPAALTVRDALYYYDGPRSEVRRASLKLDHEEVLARDVVCSPLHVGTKLFCAFPGNIAALSLDGKSKTEFEVRSKGPVTSLMTFGDRLIWLEDAGPDRLVVRSLAL